MRKQYQDGINAIVTRRADRAAGFYGFTGFYPEERKEDKHGCMGSNAPYTYETIEP